ncbi:helix-turn-helix transcriptional regulator [Streptomyces abikoensis]|uniref:helix-turn-helix transcriptional regulator n=1 Tax=Streptomyces abikoensis TaxID=97398 RepID=UPI0033C0D851
MPARLFDASRFRSARGAAQLTQAQVGQPAGASANAVANWEAGRAQPAPERLPVLAQALGLPIDRLFPRDGLPDLADLRADAGLSQAEAAARLGTRSPSVIRKAETRTEARRRALAPEYREPLASIYGVTVEELNAAQLRSFGQDVPDVRRPRIPKTLAEKINYMLERTYPGQVPSNEEIADRMNTHAGAEIISAEGVARLRTCTDEHASLKPIVIECLAEVCGAVPQFFQDDEAKVRQVVAGLKLLADGGVTRVAARGLDDDEGLPAEVLNALDFVIQEIRAKGPSAAGNGQQ